MVIRPFILLTFISIFFLTGQIHAQWSTDPYNNLIVGYGLSPELCSDSVGGCYITYEQGTTYPRHLILERLNRYGYKPWGSGRQFTGVLPEQWSAKITEDERNGVVVSYVDQYLYEDDYNFISKSRLCVQRVDSNGNFLWGSNGVRVSLSETNQHDQAIVSDGQGGCIVAWVDTMGDLRINRIDSLGTRVWGDSGKYVWNSPASPPMISDKQGGCYILYGIGRLQRLRPDGSMYWPPQGVLIPTGPWIVRLDHEKIYLFGSRYLGYNGQQLFSIHLQEVDSSGSLLWDSLGVTLDTLNTNFFLSYDFSTQCGYSTVAWPQNTEGIWDLRTQIVRNDGSTVFQYGGIPISNISSEKGIIGVLPSDLSSSVYIWNDQRSPRGTYAQQIDTLGNLSWDSSDVLLSLPELSYAKVISDANGGFIVIGTRENFTIRAQQVSKYGNLAEVITSVENIVDHFPEEFSLEQNYPNPFNPQTKISFSVPKESFITLKVYDILGREVATLVDDYQSAGYKSVNFDASSLPSCVYFYRMIAGGYTDVKRMIVVK